MDAIQLYGAMRTPMDEIEFFVLMVTYHDYTYKKNWLINEKFWMMSFKKS
jgi:hypothetical protein